MSFHEVVAELPRVPSRRTPGVVTSSPYSRPYLQGLLGSVPSLRPAHQHDAAMVLALTLGAGFRASEVAHATGPFDPAQGLVTASGFRDLAPRQVPIAQVVLGQMSAFLEPVPAGRTLIRPARVATTTRLVGRLLPVRGRSHRTCAVCAPVGLWAHCLPALTRPVCLTWPGPAI